MTKFGPEMTEEICRHLAIGMGRVDSCILANISYETFTEWMKKPEFSEAVGAAEAKFKERNIGLIQKAAIRDWKAAAWSMERKYPKEWGPHVTHANPDGSALNLHQAAILIINQIEGKKDDPAITTTADHPKLVGTTASATSSEG